jgi:hypothetical protein
VRPAPNPTSRMDHNHHEWMRANCGASRRRIFQHSILARAAPEQAWAGAAAPLRPVEASDRAGP